MDKNWPAQGMDVDGSVAGNGVQKRSDFVSI
jgi:hypothetical protein